MVKPKIKTVLARHPKEWTLVGEVDYIQGRLYLQGSLTLATNTTGRTFTIASETTDNDTLIHVCFVSIKVRKH